MRSRKAGRAVTIGLVLVSGCAMNQVPVEVGPTREKTSEIVTRDRTYYAEAYRVDADSVIAWKSGQRWAIPKDSILQIKEQGGPSGGAVFAIVLGAFAVMGLALGSN